MKFSDGKNLWQGRGEVKTILKKQNMRMRLKMYALNISVGAKDESQQVGQNFPYVMSGHVNNTAKVVSRLAM